MIKFYMKQMLLQNILEILMVQIKLKSKKLFHNFFVKLGSIKFKEK